MQPPTASSLLMMALVPLLAWRVHARFRRMVGRQRLSKWRPRIQLTVFPALVALLGYGAREHPASLVWLAAALAAGALLAWYGWKKTVFEKSPRGLFYTPNSRLGIALSLLFLARLLYRLVEVFVLQRPGAHEAGDFVRSPLTLAAFGLLAGYYIAYAVALAQWRARVLRAKRLREAAKAD